MLRHNSRNIFFFQIFELGHIFDNFDQKSQKHDFLPKNHFFGIFGTFWPKFSKVLPNLKKTIPKEVSQYDFQQNLAFLTQNYFFSLSQNVFTKKVFFCHFLKKSLFLVKFDIENRFSDSFSFQKCILSYTSATAL